jgi:DNA-binding response OmpR family regulator
LESPIGEEVGPVTDQHVLLLVNDDPGLCQALAEQLGRQQGLILHLAHSATAALDRAIRDLPALAIVDLPGAGGPDLCRRLRNERPAMPIILFGDPDSGEDVPADDILAKPIRLALLIDRIAALLAGLGTERGVDVAIGPYRFQPAAKLLTERATGREIRLTEKETEILLLLRAAGAEAISREAMLDAVWGYADGVNTHTLETHIYRLRRKIEPDAAASRILVTDPAGYRLMC